MAKRLTTTLLVALALATAAAAPAQAELPPQGVYEACGPGTDGNPICIARLDRAASAGFKLVLNYTLWYGNEAQIREYLDAAHARGLQLIIPFNAKQWRDGSDLRSHYKLLARNCACWDNASFTRYAVNLVRGHPATWGHYVGDEVNPNERDQVAALSSRIRSIDGSHPRFYVSLEDYQRPGDNLRPFGDVADVLASDSYPIGWGGTPETISGIANAVREIATGAGKRSAFVLQAFSWEMYPQIAAPDARWPTVDEMRRMRDIAIEKAAPGFLLWYSMHDILESSDPERHWADLVAAAFAPDPRDRPEIEDLSVSSRIASKRAARARLTRGLERCGRIRSRSTRSACRSRAWRRYKQGPTVRWSLTRPGTLVISVTRLERDAQTSEIEEDPVGERAHDAPAGPGAIRITGRLARAMRDPGRYRIRVTVRSPSGEDQAKPRLVRVSR